MTTPKSALTTSGRQSNITLEPEIEETEAMVTLELGCFENLVRKLPTARPLFNVDTYDEFSPQWYCCGIHVVVFMFVTIPFNIYYALALLIIGFQLGVKTQTVITSSFVIEIIAVIGTSLFCLVNFFVIDRNISRAFVFSQVCMYTKTFIDSLKDKYKFLFQVITTIVIFISATIMALSFHAVGVDYNTTHTDKETNKARSVADSLLIVVILSYCMFAFQLVTLLITLRFRLYLLVKMSSIKLAS